jgi:hypothetical protein
MAKYRAHLYFASIMMLYFIIRWIRWQFDTSAFVEYYFTDLLFVPAMGLFALIFVRLIKRDREAVIPIGAILFQTALISAYFEWYLPFHSGKSGHTSDYIDIVMYFIGAGIFIWLQRKC